MSFHIHQNGKNKVQQYESLQSAEKWAPYTSSRIRNWYNLITRVIWPYLKKVKCLQTLQIRNVICRYTLQKLKRVHKRCVQEHLFLNSKKPFFLMKKAGNSLNTH